MPRGQLLVSVHDASLECAAPHATPSPCESTDEAFVAVSVPGAESRKQTRAAPVRQLSGDQGATSAGGPITGEWHQQLSLDSKPDSRAMEFHVYGRTGGGGGGTAGGAEGGAEGKGGGHLLASGSLDLRGVFETDAQAASIPLVGPTGKHAGDLSVRIVFIHPRSAGKQRDALGREVLTAMHGSPDSGKWPPSPPSRPPASSVF